MQLLQPCIPQLFLTLVQVVQVVQSVAVLGVHNDLVSAKLAPLPLEQFVQCTG